MSSRLRENLPAALGASLGILIVGWLALTNWAWTDYDTEARPAFDALLGGHFLRFLQVAPAYGGSLVMRAPFVLVTRLWHGGELSTFRVAAAPCLIAGAVLGVWLVARMRGFGQSRDARVIALFLCVANPVVLPTLESGHPEELLGGALCVAAVLLAMGKRPVWSGVLLGLAIANKEWALLAVGPVLIALPEKRLQALLWATGVAGVILAPLVLAGGLVSRVNAAATQADVIFNPWQVWWFFGTHAHVIRDSAGHVIPGHLWANRVSPAWVGSLSHPLILLLSAPLTWICLRLRRAGDRRPAGEPLLLLAVLLLMRCLLDPWDVVYYSLPFLLALLGWEALTCSRPPVLALIGSCLAWFLFEWVTPAHGFSPDGQSLVFMICALTALAGLAVRLFAPGLSERLRLAFARRRAIPAAG